MGFYGFCAPEQRTGVTAPDCEICGAPHQSDRGCWLCSRHSGNDPSGAAFHLRALANGISVDGVLARHSAEGYARDLDAVLSDLIRERWA